MLPTRIYSDSHRLVVFFVHHTYAATMAIHLDVELSAENAPRIFHWHPQSKYQESHQGQLYWRPEWETNPWYQQCRATDKGQQGPHKRKKPHVLCMMSLIMRIDRQYWIQESVWALSTLAFFVLDTMKYEVNKAKVKHCMMALLRNRGTRAGEP